MEVTNGCCELLSNFLYFCSRNNAWACFICSAVVVNCSQIFCTFAVETTGIRVFHYILKLWIALKFFVLLQSKQLNFLCLALLTRCELLSNFLYFCSRNNAHVYIYYLGELWIALKFFVLLQSKQPMNWALLNFEVVNCSQIFCTFAVETTKYLVVLLKIVVVNCSQIFCTFAVETTCPSHRILASKLWIALKFFVLLQSKQHVRQEAEFLERCELLSNFLYFCSRNNTIFSPSS